MTKEAKRTIIFRDGLKIYNLCFYFRHLADAYIKLQGFQDSGDVKVSESGESVSGTQVCTPSI